jgi:hypothetical protein
VIDHFDVLTATLEAVKDLGLGPNDIQFSGDVTDRRLYLRGTVPGVEVEARELLERYKRPDQHRPGGNWGVAAGFVMGNSETGCGRWFIAPRVVVLLCANGIIRTSDELSHVHLGTKMDEGVVEWSNTTRRKVMEAIMSQTKDALKKFLSPEYVGSVVTAMANKSVRTLEHPIDAMKNVGKLYGFSEERTNAVLDFFVKSNDLTPFGVSQAVTFYAHEQDDADLQYDLERVGIEVMDAAVRLDKPVTN